MRGQTGRDGEKIHTPQVSSFRFLPPPTTSMTECLPSSAIPSVQDILKALHELHHAKTYREGRREESYPHSVKLSLLASPRHKHDCIPAIKGRHVCAELFEGLI